MKEWFQLMDQLAPSVVKIETPTGSGTGFLCAYNEAGALTAIATAHHVVEEADKWQQPIRIHLRTNTVLLQEPDRVILSDKDRATDSAVIMASPLALITLQLPKNPVPLAPSGRHLKVGVEVGWLAILASAPKPSVF